MLKIVVFDSGYGGELFADKLEEEIPVVEVIRVIDWRNAEEILKNPRRARKAAKEALRPYLGKVDLIIFANQLLTLTSLRYFRRKYKKQAFVGLGLERPRKVKEQTVVLTTRAVCRTMNYQHYLLKVKGKIATVCLDTWPEMIDDGELTDSDVNKMAGECLAGLKKKPGRVVLACSHFCDIKDGIRRTFGHNVNICDDVEETIREVYLALNLRGICKPRER